MKKLVKKREHISMDLTPLIDVVFLLLIFFIVASEFKKNETILNLTLPSSSSSQKVVVKKESVLEVSKDSFALNAQKLDFTQLKQELKNIKKELPLIVKIDEDVKYSRVIKILDTLNNLSLTNLQLITKQENK